MNLDFRPALPALIVAVTALATLLAQAFTPRGRRAPSTALSLLGLAFAAVYVFRLAALSPRPSMGGTLVADDFSLFLQALLLGVTALTILSSASYLRACGMERGEYHTLVLFSCVGMMGLVSATDLISIFVALEIMSVALYALAGMRRDLEESQESAIKYFVTGAFASSFFLFGVALLYGVSGSTRIADVAQNVSPALSSGTTPLAILGMTLILVGVGFKVAAVPFHMWAPDVYEGAPTPVTAFMAAGVKAAAFGALVRIFGVALVDLAPRWQSAIAILAVLSMVIGNLGALAQTNLKRLLAYSSIAHAGYLLTALVAAPRMGAEAVLFYLVAYAVVNLGSFGVIAALANAGREPLSIADLAGMGRRRPLLAAMMTVFMISLTGIPVSAGFVGKFQLFRAAVYAGHARLAVVGVVMSVVSAYYYLRIVVSMYMRDEEDPDEWSRIGAASGVVLGFATIVTLALGVFPGRLLELARLAAQSLR